MKSILSQEFKTSVQYVKKNPSIRFCKMLYLCCFFAGFVLFVLLGKEMLEKIALLDIDSLKEIKDCDLDCGNFLLYVLWRRMLVLGVGVFLWYWGLGKWFVYGGVGVSAVSMGICMYTCLMRYRLKGLFLWFFLYFPHVLFYGAVFLCGIFLSAEVFRTKKDRLQFLWRNSLWLLILFAAFATGIYMEGYVNTALLQDYLGFF